MKRLVSALVVALVLWAQPASAAFAVVVTTAQSVGDFGGTTASSINTSGSNLLVLEASTLFAVPVTVSDATGSCSSPCNTWTKLTTYTNGSIVSAIYYATNPTVGSGHVFTFSAEARVGSIAVIGFSGADTSAPFDSGKDAGSNTASGSTLSPGTLTPSANDYVVVTGIAAGQGWGAIGTLTEGTGFTRTWVDWNAGANTSACGIAYKIQTTAGAETPSWTAGASSGMASGMAVFKSSGGGPPPSTPCNLKLMGVGCEVVH